ncbi:hypothetical protein DB347_00395 [Opitutaceae bacterium EW11]|nr:hypothetical protein DB347_00395 [Opitutaceae bacterium EW11]
MTRFFLVRHGQKTTPDPLLVGRTPGIHLSEHGRAQADAIAERLGAEEIARVVSSPLERARETAEPLARLKGLKVETMAEFHETDFGEWTGHTIDQLAGVSQWRRYNEFRSATPAPGGETMLQMQQRFVSGMLTLRGRYPSQGVAIFSHGDPLRAAIAYFAGAPVDFWHRFEIGVGSISVVDLGDDCVKIQKLNDVPLPNP